MLINSFKVVRRFIHQLERDVLRNNYSSDHRQQEIPINKCQNFADLPCCWEEAEDDKAEENEGGKMTQVCKPQSKESSFLIDLIENALFL